MIQDSPSPHEPRTTVVNVKTDEYDVYIGRSNRRYKLPLSIWANPFKIGPDGTREEVIAKYREYVLAEPRLMARLPELRGKRLGCWCHPEPCHGDVLTELANALEPHTLDPRAGTPTPEPMSEARMVELRDKASQIRYGQKRTDGFYEAVHVHECLDEIRRLRAVIAERDAEIGRLKGDLNEWRGSGSALDRLDQAEMAATLGTWHRVDRDVFAHDAVVGTFAHEADAEFVVMARNHIKAALVTIAMLDHDNEALIQDGLKQIASTFFEAYETEVPDER